MNYTSVYYYILVSICVLLYYSVKKTARRYVLLLGSLVFLFLVSGSLITPAVFILSVLLGWFFGRKLEKKKSRGLLWTGILVSALPLLVMKADGFSAMYLHKPFGFVYPVGISFYTMQMIAYLADIYRGKICAQQDALCFLLFMSWFPQLVQGPIPRYEQLSHQLEEGHDYDPESFMKGIQLILWGFFLKLMIADKAGVFVDSVFGSYRAWQGIPVWTAAVLYSVQIYTDFLACTTLSRGVSQLFGISLMNNFDHPYISSSIKEFWRRWHISLSSWLRDYVYIPLGGNRKGHIRKYINLFIVFLVSGLWHGIGMTFLLWGCMHAFFQVFSEVTKESRGKIAGKSGMSGHGRKNLSRFLTFLLVTLGWIVFRAESVRAAVKIVLSLFAFNPWTLTDGTLLRMGLDLPEWIVLVIAMVIWIKVEQTEMKMDIGSWIRARSTPVRWMIYLGVIWCVFLFGTYGYGFSAGDFIYGGF